MVRSGLPPGDDAPRADIPLGNAPNRSGEESDTSGQETSSPAGRRADNLVGTTLAGRFEIVEAIARGGMGVIYKAIQQPLGRSCAIKVMRPSFDPEQTAEFHRRFFLEAATAAKLTHPNTVTVFDYGNEGDLYFIAMEYIRGRTLRQVLRDEGTLESGRAIHIAVEICRSLQEAHRLGVVHRDLKPENVFVVEGHDDLDTIKVLDFGLVKSIKGANADTLTTGGLCVGSPSYMAPEQVDGDEVTAGTDVYSLGIVLYEMVCGRPPFVRNSKYALVMAHLSDAPPPMTAHLPADKLPQGLSEVVSRCIAKKPEERYASMEEVLEEFHRISEGRPPMSTTMRRRARDGEGPPAVALRSSGPMAAREGSIPGDGPSATSTTGSVLSVQPPEPGVLPKRRTKPSTWVAVGALVFAVGGGLTHLAVRADAPSPEPSNARPSPDAGRSSAAPASTSAPAVADPSPRRVRIESEPPGAQVALDERRVCEKTPCDLSWSELGGPSDAGVALRLTLTGYEPAEVEVDAGQERIAAKLTPVRVRTPSPPPVAPPATKKPEGTPFNLSPY